MIPRIFPALVAGLLMLGSVHVSFARKTVPLAEGWHFVRKDVPPTAPFSSWKEVSVPHCWNAIDGQNGKAANPNEPDGYYRGPGWYARDISIPDAWKNRRVFAWFGAASLVADVYVNGHHLGQHRGGFAAFCYELTPYLKFGGKNTLRVRVDNAHFADVPPLSGDFTVEGGLYRSVHLLVTDPVCISPLDHASPGVFLTEKVVTPVKAVVEVATHVSNALANPASCMVKAELLDASGHPVQAETGSVDVSPNGTGISHVTLTIDHPHLWAGRPDPYLYHVRILLIRGNTVVDEVTQPLGLRTVIIDPKRGFLLNGNPYPIRGVNRHQEKENEGWALSKADQAEDFKIILDMGTTAVRLAHYQQSNYVHELCDHNGLILWQEIPLVNEVNNTPAFNANAEQQLTEMILQGYNNPSLCMWGLYNEQRAPWAHNPTPPEPLLRKLQALAKKLDPSRPTVAASWTEKPLPMYPIPDDQSFNMYPGWYYGTPAEFTKLVDEGSADIGGRKIAVSEYGAGGNPHQHEEGKLKHPDPGGQFHPEEWQAYVHEQEWAQAVHNPHLWGTFIWCMFDFASDGRNEGGTPGINDKGLVTHDRKIKKDAYFFYQANWTTKPMIYIASRRMTPRKLPVTTVKIYSNCPQVELTVNGKSQGTVKPNDVHVFRWKGVHLQPGKNVIDVTGHDGNRTVTDSCDWVLKTESKP